jgi:hypothetical protein
MIQPAALFPSSSLDFSLPLASGVSTQVVPGFVPYTLHFVDPMPAPETTPVSPAPTTAPAQVTETSTPAVVTLEPGQFTAVTAGIVLILVLLAAILISQMRRP